MLRTSLYAAPAYLAQRGVPATLDALQAADWLMLQDGTDQPRRLPGSELSVLPRYTSNNQLTLQQLCEAGLGLAALGDEDVAESAAAGRLLRLDTALALPELPIWAMTPQHDAQPAKVRTCHCGAQGPPRRGAMKGRLTQWDDAKGYGFITPEEGGAKLFVHVKAFGLRPHRPFIGERLSYREGQDAQGKKRAVGVQSLEPRPASASCAPIPTTAALCC